MFSFQGASSSYSPRFTSLALGAPLRFRLLNFSFKKLNETSKFLSLLQSVSYGGEYRDRTGDLLLARQALSQLS